MPVKKLNLNQVKALVVVRSIFLMAVKNRKSQRISRHARVRNKVIGTLSKPRLSVYRSLNNIYVQIIDDDNGNTIASASSLEDQIKSDIAELNKVDASKLIGHLIAQRAKDQGVQSVVFDRGGYKYHGRVKAIADAAREEGLEF